MFKRISINAIAILIVLITTVTGIAYAISNPDDIQMPTYAVFENVGETGDMLFVAEAITDYTTEPTDYTASEAFLFELLNTSGNVTMFSKPLNDYGDRPISIYLTATQVTAAGITSGDALILKVRGNPLIFASETGNSVNATLVEADYIDQSIGGDSEIPTENNLRNYLILMAIDIEAFDTPTDDYITDVQGYKYLTNAGGDIFITGIPDLPNLCPILFQYGASRVNADVPESTGSYANTLTIADKWGETAAQGLTNLGVWMGISQALAGSVMLFLCAIGAAIFAYSRTNSSIAAVLVVAVFPFIGAFLGLVPLAIAFIIVILIILFAAYFFVSRGLV